jgi:DNA-binding transcriptional LysR family regulator
VPSTVYYFLSQVISRYHERYPKIKVRVLDAGANEVLTTVTRGEADFGLNFVGSQEPDIEFKPLMEERFVAACRRDHPLAKKRRVTWAELAQYDYISVSKAPGTCEREGAAAEHLRNAARDDDARAGRSGSRGRGSPVHCHAGRRSSSPGERAAARARDHPEDRPDPAQGTLLVAGGAADL